MKPSTFQIKQMTDSYIEALLFGTILEPNEDGFPIWTIGQSITEMTPADDIFTIEDISEEDKEKVKEDCTQFLTKECLERLNNPNNGLGEEETHFRVIGHDFYYTRAGHGTGFWDGRYKHGEWLTQWAKSFGWNNTNIYIDDEGKPVICSS